MQMWEFGHIRRIRVSRGGPFSRNDLYIYYWEILTPDGIEREEIGKTTVKNDKEVDEEHAYYWSIVPKYIANLGLNGWEAFGELYNPHGDDFWENFSIEDQWSKSSPPEILHFKRPIEE